MIKNVFKQLKNLTQPSQNISSLFFATPAMLSGILCFSSYPPFPAWAVFFCFAPVWNHLYQQKSLKKVLVIAFICQFVTTLGGFYWVAHTAWEFGHIPVPLNIVVMLLFCCIASLHMLVAPICTHLVHRKLNLRPGFYFLTLAVLYSFFEFAIPSIFPWNMGYPLLFSKLKTAQLAEFVGFNFISLFVLLINALFAFSFYNFPKPGWTKPLLIFLVALGLTEFLGQQTLKNLPIEDKKISALMVQTNMGSFEKYWRQYGQNYQIPIINKIFSLTEQVIIDKKPDLVVWPENAFPANLDLYYQHEMYQQNLFQFIKKNQINLITGSYSQDAPSSQGMKDYSGMFLFNKNSEQLGFYRKTILLAFGEYIPGADYFPFLKKLIPEISELGRGPGPTLLTFDGVKLSPIICYEAIYSTFVADFSNLGSHIILNTTNDSWYGNFSEQKQHLTMSVARSVELRKPQIRATNTGISAISDVRGNLLVQTPINQEWAQIIDVPYYDTPQKTLYSKIHKWVFALFSSLVLLVLLIDIIFHVKKGTGLV